MSLGMSEIADVSYVLCGRLELNIPYKPLFQVFIIIWISCDVDDINVSNPAIMTIFIITHNNLEIDLTSD